MFCRFCGEKIDEKALFCPKCGRKQIENEINLSNNTTDCSTNPIKKKVPSDKIMKIIQKCCFGGFVAGIIGVVLFLGIVVNGLTNYGRVLLFGYDFYGGNSTKVPSIISIVFMMIGLCGIIVKLVLFYIFKIGTLPTTTIKRVLLIVLAVACLGFSMWGFVDCSNNSNSYDSSYDSDYSGGNTTTSITRSQAISYAKSSSTVQNKIANLYDLKFYYTPDWGTTTASQDSDGDWTVQIKGTISGYTDDYKTDFVYDKKFTVRVTVYSSGYVGYVYASKY